MDKYDEMNRQITRANKAARILANWLPQAGVPVAEVENATYTTDAAITLDKNRHITVSLDCCFTVVERRGDAFYFSKPFRQHHEVAAALAN